MDNDKTKTLADVDAELNAWARARGFKSHWHMATQLELGKAKLSNAQIRRGLEEFKPIADSAAIAAAKAAVDATNLPAIQDMHKSVARMMRVLLLGYDQEEMEFLQHRAVGIKFLGDVRENTLKAGERRMERLDQYGQEHVLAEEIRHARMRMR